MRSRSTTFGRVASLALLASLSLAACGGADGGTDDMAGDSTPAAADVDVAGGAAGAAEAPITEADLDAYERALTAEVELLRAAVQSRAEARTSEDTLAAMTAAMEAETEPAAAERAGIAVERYRRLDDAFGRAVGARLQSPGMLESLGGGDTSFLASLPATEAAERRAQIEETRRQLEAAYGDSAIYASVPPALHEPFKARAAASLEALWRERLELRMKAAGLAR